MSGAGPSRARLHERGEAEARRAHPRVRAAADALSLRGPLKHVEAAWNRLAASEGAHE
jgi:hypothetical protein